MIKSDHWVQYTPSTASTEYSIHRVKHTLSTAYTAYCIIPTTTVSCYQPVSHLAADHDVQNHLHAHNYKLANEWNVSCHRAPLLNYHQQIHRLQVLFQSRSIMASKCMSKLTPSPPRSVSLTWHNSSLQGCTMTASKWISTPAQSRTQTPSLKSHGHGLQVHLQSRSITATKWISNLACLQSRSASVRSLHHGLVTRQSSHGMSREFLRQSCSSWRSVG